jgi:hypothetical protein
MVRGVRHILKHNVTESEVEQVLRRSGEEFSGTNHSRIRLGKNEAGRLLQVVYAPDEAGDGLFVVTAYELTPKAKKAYRKRQKRKRK